MRSLSPLSCSTFRLAPLMLNANCALCSQQDAFGFQNPFSPPPSFLAFDSAQEYLKALILADSKDVERIAALPVAESSDGSEEEEPEALLSIDVWVFEHLR